MCCPVHWTLFANLAHPIEDYHLELYNTSFPGPIDRKLYHLAPPPTNRNLYFPTKSQLFPEGQVELALIQGKILRRVSFFCFKVFSQIIFPILFRSPNHQIADKKIKLNLPFKLSYLNLNVAQTLCYITEL